MSSDALAAGPLPLAVSQRTRSVGREVLVGAALLAGALVLSLATVGHYGLTVDEFNADDYGPKALAWYTSRFTDRSHFENVEIHLWYYGPWFHILVALVQSFNVAHPHTVRHALTFMVGLAGLAALVPIARLTVGRWAGPIAIGLCLTTGYLYGSLFFTPIDVPFMAAMTWATLATLVMARHPVPTWPAAIGAGLLTGLAMATRTGGIITHAYLVGLMGLCALQLAVLRGRAALPAIAQIVLRTLGCIAIAWLVAIALWPWLQVGNPLRQFATAYVHFNKLTNSFDFPHWGLMVTTDNLPWHYIPGQFLARLPEGFLMLLGIGAVFAVAAAWRLSSAAFARYRARGIAGLATPALLIVRARGVLLIVCAVVAPIAFLMVKDATLYDGVRHVLFVIPLLALLAAGAWLRVLAFLRRVPIAAGLAIALGGAHVGATVASMIELHPLEYVAINSFAGGTAGAAGRFDLDYWSVAASVALRSLERRLDDDSSGRFASAPARVMVCVQHREWIADRLFRRNWMVAVDVDKADFVVDSERWRCTKNKDHLLIGEVQRQGVTFSRIFAGNRGLP